jgi:hypothetical protein
MQSTRTTSAPTTGSSSRTQTASRTVATRRACGPSNSAHAGQRCKSSPYAPRRRYGGRVSRRGCCQGGRTDSRKIGIRSRPRESLRHSLDNASFEASNATEEDDLMTLAGVPRSGGPEGSEPHMPAAALHHDDPARQHLHRFQTPVQSPPPMSAHHQFGPQRSPPPKRLAPPCRCRRFRAQLGRP